HLAPGEHVALEPLGQVGARRRVLDRGGGRAGLLQQALRRREPAAEVGDPREQGAGVAHPCASPCVPQPGATMPGVIPTIGTGGRTTSLKPIVMPLVSFALVAAPKTGCQFGTRAIP